MSNNEDELDEEFLDRDFLTEALEASGYKVIDLDSLMAILNEMNRQIMHETDIDTEDELEFYLDKLEELVGPEEARTLDINQVIAWVRALKSI